MKLVEHLSAEQKQQLRKRLKSEQLSRRDWEEIMGKYVDTYVRKNGAWRRK